MVNITALYTFKSWTYEDISVHLFCIRGGTALAQKAGKSKPEGLIRANHAKAWDAKPLT